MSERIPPHNHEAENAVLGSVLLSKGAALDLLTLEPGDFHRDLNRRLFAAARGLRARGETVDSLTLGAAMAGDVQAEQVGMHLVECAETATDRTGEGAARIVAELAVRRRLLDDLQLQIVAGHQTVSEYPTAEFITSVNTAVISAMEHRDRESRPITAGAAVTAFLERAKATDDAARLASGFDQRDEMTAGLLTQKLYVVAARPGEGKTSIALNMAYNVAEWIREQVHFFSLEMGGDELGLRTLQTLGAVDGLRLLNKTVTVEENARINQAALRASSAPVTFDTTIYYLEDILARAHRLRKQGCRVFFVDYLGLVETRDGYEKEHQRITTVCKALKRFAKTTDAHVTLLCQFTKENHEKQPHAGDLYGGQGIEANADVIELLFSPVAFGLVPDISDNRELMFGKIVKCRHGDRGTVHYRFDRKFATYSTWDGPPPSLIKKGGRS